MFTKQILVDLLRNNWQTPLKKILKRQFAGCCAPGNSSRKPGIMFFWYRRLKSERKRLWAFPGEPKTEPNSPGKLRWTAQAKPFPIISNGNLAQALAAISKTWCVN